MPACPHDTSFARLSIIKLVSRAQGHFTIMTSTGLPSDSSIQKGYVHTFSFAPSHAIFLIKTSQLQWSNHNSGAAHPTLRLRLRNHLPSRQVAFIPQESQAPKTFSSTSGRVHRSPGRRAVRGCWESTVHTDLPEWAILHSSMGESSVVSASVSSTATVTP